MPYATGSLATTAPRLKMCAVSYSHACLGWRTWQLPADMADAFAEELLTDGGDIGDDEIFQVSADDR